MSAKPRTMDFVHDCADQIEHVPDTQYIVIALMPGGRPVLRSKLGDQSEEDWAKMRAALFPLFAEQNHKHEKK